MRNTKTITIELERGIIRERVKASIAYAKSNGQMLGRPGVILELWPVPPRKRSVSRVDDWRCLFTGLNGSRFQQGTASTRPKSRGPYLVPATGDRANCVAMRCRIALLISFCTPP